MSQERSIRVGGVMLRAALATLAALSFAAVSGCHDDPPPPPPAPLQLDPPEEETLPRRRVMVEQRVRGSAVGEPPMGLAGIRFLGFATVEETNDENEPTSTRYEVSDFRKESQGGTLNVLRGGAAINVIDGRLERRFLVGQDDPSTRLLVLLEQIFGNESGTGVSRPDAMRALISRPREGMSAGDSWTIPGRGVIRMFAGSSVGELDGFAHLTFVGPHTVGERHGERTDIRLELPSVVVRTTDGPRETSSYTLTVEVFAGEDFFDYELDRSFAVMVTDNRGQDSIPVTYTTRREVSIRDIPDPLRGR